MCEDSQKSAYFSRSSSRACAERRRAGVMKGSDGAAGGVHRHDDCNDAEEGTRALAPKAPAQRHREGRIIVAGSGGRGE
jgi:hypothetical protein